MERTTRLVVVIGALALLAGHLAIGRAWSGMPIAASASLIAGTLLGIRSPNLVAPVIAASCLVPPIVWFSLETFSTQYWIVWLAALLGVLLPGTVTTNWQSPPRWRLPVVLAALALVVGTPLIIVRELDFNAALLSEPPAAVLSGLPWFSVEWVLLVAVAAVVGILWFDWLVGQRRLDLEHAVLAPLTLSITASAAAAIYQMFGDITFINQTAYAAIGRAGGTMFDANVSGVLSAMAVGFAAYLATGGAQRRVWLATMPLLVLSVWASGSRTAFAALAIVAVASVSAWRREAGLGFPRANARTAGAVLGMAVLVILVGLLASQFDTTTVGPLRRFSNMMPGAHGRSFGGAVAELWNRNGYGAAATYLIQRHPWTGIGVGGFHLFGPPMTPMGPLPPDNAQNWLRHQVVEMGLLGSAGWILFSVTLTLFLITSARHAAPRSLHLHGVVLALGAVSLFGMPTQEVVPAVTFWAAVAALVREDRHEDGWQPLGRLAMVLVIALSAAFALMTWDAATTRLRLPARARLAGWPFSYGLYSPEPDGAGGTVRWMADRATALIDVDGPYMRLSIRAPLPNVETDPVGVKVWAEGDRVIDARLNSGAPVTATVTVPPGLRKLILDLEVTRTVRPRDLDGRADDRQLGALVSWTFAATP